MTGLEHSGTSAILGYLAARDELDLNRARVALRSDQRRGDLPEEALIRANLVSEETIARIHAEVLSLPWLCLVLRDGEPHIQEMHGTEEVADRGPVSACLHLHDTAAAISEVVCRKRKVAPIALDGEVLDLACLDPSAFHVVEEVQLRTGLVIRPVAATLSLVEKVADLFFGERDMVRELVREVESTALEIRQEEVTLPADPRIIIDLDGPAPTGRDGDVINLVNLLLRSAVEQGASDIHLEPYEEGVRARFRIDGRLVEVTPPPGPLFVPVISRLKILAKMDIAEKRVPQDGAIALRSGRRRVDLRLSTVPTVFGEKMVIRLLEKESIPDSLDELGFTAEQAAAFMEAARARSGLIFVTGPTGSGKSTSLYCCLKQINDPSKNILTVEDPVEYRFFGLNQINVRSAVGLDFATTLRAFLRQDPDVIMVGEVRDPETAQTCMRAALTGHLVLSTLHTNDAIQVIHRLGEMGVEPYLLGSALRLIEAQRLVRRLCPACKVPARIPPEMAASRGLDPELVYYEAAPDGCPRCRGLGYRGRIGLFEVIPIADELAEMISRRAPLVKILEEVRRAGHALLADAARMRMEDGTTSFQEVEELLR